MPAPKPLIPLSKIPNFDPRKVPALPAGEGLSALSPASFSATALRRRFAAPPAWQADSLVEPRLSNSEPVQASVLIALVQRPRPMVLLTQRTAHMSTHSGQIAFPGGKRDAGDADLHATALREAHEEVGLQPEFVEVLGDLPVYSTVSGFAVTPVVALVHEGVSLVRNTYEVEDVFEVPLDFLMDPANHYRHLFEWQGQQREWMSMPYKDGGSERFIWGATAAMLRNFYRFLAA